MKVNYKQIICSSLLGLGLTLATGVSNQAVAFVFTENPNTGGVGNPVADSLWNVGIGTSDIGKAFTMDWLVPLGTQGDQTVPVNLSAQGIFLVDGFTTVTRNVTTPVCSKVKGKTVCKTVTNTINEDKLTMSVLLANTTKLQNTSDNTAILSFGFNVNPDATNITSIRAIGGNNIELKPSNRYFDYNTWFNNYQEKNVSWTSATNVTFPAFQTIDACVYSANNCTGGNIAQGLQAANSSQGGTFYPKAEFDVFKVELTGDFTNDNNQTFVTLSDFALKFQGTYGSFEVAGDNPDDTPPEDNPLLEIPEPSTTAALGILVLGGLGFLRKKKVG